MAGRSAPADAAPCYSRRQRLTVSRLDPPFPLGGSKDRMRCCCKRHPASVRYPRSRSAVTQRARAGGSELRQYACFRLTQPRSTLPTRTSPDAFHLGDPGTGDRSMSIIRRPAANHGVKYPGGCLSERVQSEASGCGSGWARRALPLCPRQICPERHQDRHSERGPASALPA